MNQFDPVQMTEWLNQAKQTERILFPASRVIRSIGYFPPMQMLEVEQRGRNYRTILQYFGVSGQIVELFIAARSKAAIFYQHVEGKYPKQEVDSRCSVFREPPWQSYEPAKMRHDVHQYRQAQLWGWK